MTIQTATNPQTGERIQLINGAWQPIRTATNPKTGERIENVGGQWRPLGGAKAPAPSAAPSAAPATAMDPARPVSAPAKPGLKEKIGAAVGGVNQGLTFGFGDEIEAVLASAIPVDRMVSKDADIRFGDFKGNLAQIRERNAAQREAAPGLHLAGEIGGSLGAGGAGLAKMGAVKGGAVGGGAYGFGTAEGNPLERLPQAGVGAALGAGGGYALDKAAKALTPGVSRATDAFRARMGLAPRANATAPLSTPDGLKDQARTLYNAVDDHGGRFTPEAAAQLRARVDASLDDPRLGFDPVLHRTAARLKADLDAAGDELTVTQLRNFTKRAKRVTDRGRHAGEDGYAAGQVREAFDAFMDANPGIVPGAGQGARTGRELADQVREANDLWRRASTAEALEEAMSKAGRRAQPSVSGNGMDRRLRSELEKLATGRNARFLSPELRARLLKTSQGNAARNSGAYMSAFDPTTGHLSGMLSTGAAMGSGGASLPLNAFGAVAGRMATQATKRDARGIMAELLRGGPAPAPKGLPSAGLTPAPALMPAPATPMASTPAPSVLADSDLDRLRQAERDRLVLARALAAR